VTITATVCETISAEARHKVAESSDVSRHLNHILVLFFLKENYSTNSAHVTLSGGTGTIDS
jgi:hypothetical protein